MFSGIIIHDLVINDAQNDARIFLGAQRINVYLSMKIFLGFISNPIRHIEFENVELNVIRASNKKVNIVEFLKKFKGQGGNVSFDISFNNISGFYEDHRGWGASASFFKVPFSSGSGQIQVNSKTKTMLSFNALIDGSQDESSIQGELSNAGFYYEFDVNSLRTDHWSTYLVPFPKIKVADDFLQISGRLRSNPHSSKKRLLYELTMSFDYLNIESDFFTFPFENVSGRLLLSNRKGVRLEFQEVKAEMKRFPLNISGDVQLDKKWLNLSMASSKPIQSSELFAHFPRTLIVI